MRVGIVSYWFNRGQAVVSRRIRAALDAAGFTTCVLARPTKGSFVRSGFIDRSGPWAQRGITAASRYEIPEVEYLEWAADNMLDLVLCDQNLQFRELAALRRRGVRTVGRFVWEAFGPGDVAGAHFFAPANVMKLFEVVKGTKTSLETIVSAMKVGRDIGKISAVAGTCDGFAANRSPRRTR